MKCNGGKFGLFCGGFLFGTAGLKVLASRGANKRAEPDDRLRFFKRTNR